MNEKVFKLLFTATFSTIDFGLFWCQKSAKIGKAWVSMVYADIIVDISHENLDKTYQYRVPEEFYMEAQIGVQVLIPFGNGNRVIKGYIVGLSAEAKIPPDKIKSLIKVIQESLMIESHFICLAYWIKDHYGATMNDALKTVIPIKRTVKKKEEKYIKMVMEPENLTIYLEEFRRKHNTARVRLLEALLNFQVLDYSKMVNEEKISRSTIKDLEEKKIIKVVSERIYRNPVKGGEKQEYNIVLNEEQRKAADIVIHDWKQGNFKTYLLHGVTGSGKTEVYMEIINQVIHEKKQVIMLVPEIALTFQTVTGFYRRFGDRISVLHSRLSKGERYDQYERAKNGEIDVMIGPRSALFTPFQNLGLIIIDEEHEGSYKSDTPPKYHARETAIERARLLHASVLLGSATPSLESYKKAEEGEYQLLCLPNRAGQGKLPKVWVVDLREELKKKNISIFSEALKIRMQDRLEKKEQIMLFLNRRGYAGFVSCRSCGYVFKCPHCDVSLTSHYNGKMLCHYCGYQEEKAAVCPSCKSKYVAAFGTGTQKVEEMVKKEFPLARVLRMDTDTTKGKDGYEKILTSFASQEADILVGTQMIVKGHDFPMVTLVGILAADLSLYANDYRAGERTFQLLCQASGRAGRGAKEGEVIIQSYNPEHYSIQMAARGDYLSFYQEEMLYRSAMSYPPVENMLLIVIASKIEDQGVKASNLLYQAIKENQKENTLKIIGPAKASVSKINDIYRRVLYIKYKDYNILKNIKDYLEGFIEFSQYFKGISVQFDFNPMNGC